MRPSRPSAPNKPISDQLAELSERAKEAEAAVESAKTQAGALVQRAPAPMPEPLQPQRADLAGGTAQMVQRLRTRLKTAVNWRQFLLNNTIVYRNFLRKN